MGQEMYLSDNQGNRVGPGVTAIQPVLASGITLSGGTAGSDVTQTVTAGAVYIISFPIDSGTWLLSLSGVTSTAANREFIGHEGCDIIIQVPWDKTTLYFECSVGTQSAYMRQVK